MIFINIWFLLIRQFQISHLHTHAEYYIIMMGPLGGRYKNEGGDECEGIRTSFGGKKHERKLRN